MKLNRYPYKTCFARVAFAVCLFACGLPEVATAAGEEASKPGSLLARPPELESFYRAPSAREPGANDLTINGYVFDPVESQGDVPSAMRQAPPGSDGARAVVVQFKGPITREDRTALKEL